MLHGDRDDDDEDDDDDDDDDDEEEEEAEDDDENYDEFRDIDECVTNRPTDRHGQL